MWLGTVAQTEPSCPAVTCVLCLHRRSPPSINVHGDICGSFGYMFLLPSDATLYVQEVFASSNALVQSVLKAGKAALGNLADVQRWKIGSYILFP